MIKPLLLVKVVQISTYARGEKKSLMPHHGVSIRNTLIETSYQKPVPKLPPWFFFHRAGIWRGEYLINSSSITEVVLFTMTMLEL